MDQFIVWLGATPVSLYFQTEAWIVPLVQTIHILALAATFSSMAMLDARLLGFAGRKHSIQAQTQRFLPALWIALPILLVTGMMLITAEPKRSLENPAFYMKMLMLAASLVIVYFFQRSVKNRPDLWSNPDRRPGIAPIIGLVSLLLWIGIIIAGRLIAYV